MLKKDLIFESFLVLKFLVKSLAIFVSPELKLNDQYCHIDHVQVRMNYAFSSDLILASILTI